LPDTEKVVRRKNVGVHSRFCAEVPSGAWLSRYVRTDTRFSQ